LAIGVYGNACPMIATAIPFLHSVVQKKDIIESNKRAIVRRQEREMRKLQKRQLPPPS
jgi:heme exporter protein D